MPNAYVEWAHPEIDRLTFPNWRAKVVAESAQRSSMTTDKLYQRLSQNHPMLADIDVYNYGPSWIKRLFLSHRSALFVFTLFASLSAIFVVLRILNRGSSEEILVKSCLLYNRSLVYHEFDREDRRKAIRLV